MDAAGRVTLAHELRNPLAPIRSGLGVMRLSRDATPAMTRVREMMERQVSHMMYLVDDLLDVTRISGGKLNKSAKYTPPGGRIVLAPGREGLDALVAVSDTGVGIPAHALQTVFDMFSQVGSGSRFAVGCRCRPSPSLAWPR